MTFATESIKRSFARIIWSLYIVILCYRGWFLSALVYYLGDWSLKGERFLEGYFCMGDVYALWTRSSLNVILGVGLLEVRTYDRLVKSSLVVIDTDAFFWVFYFWFYSTNWVRYSIWSFACLNSAWSISTFCYSEAIIFILGSIFFYGWLHILAALVA